MATPGMAGGFGTGASAGMTEQQIQEQKMIKLMGWAAQESCAGKSVIAGVMGFGLGGMFGLFMSSMRYDNNMTPQGEAISKLPMRQQLSQGFREMGKASWSSAKNFGIIGAAYSGTECCIEGLRAKNDLANGVMAGCITGGGLAAKNGPQAMAIGCAGFAAFSAAIDYYTRLPSDDPGADVVT